MRQSQKRKKNSLSKVPLKRYLFVLYRLLVGWGKTVFAGGSINVNQSSSVSWIFG